MLADKFDSGQAAAIVEITGEIQFQNSSSVVGIEPRRKRGIVLRAAHSG
jgi:hypothetical protein